MTILKKISPLFLICAVIGDFSLPYYLGRFYSDFNQMTMIISQLGEPTSPVQNYFNNGSVVTGTLFVLASFGIYVFFQSESKRFAQIIAGAIALYGFGDCILTGLVHISESASFFSPAYFLHAAFSGISMVAMMFVPLVLAYQATLKQQKVLSLFYSVCLIGSILALLLFAAYYLPVIGRWLSSTRGFWQRLSLFFLYLPALSIAFRQLAKKN
ncbi:DUF998 domain-containing protein [Enterococcus avium]|jgi:hypothetical protein|uniref:DUF998 domain-containing protein n=1 Tax=Enterococcus avium TaxID=33945 RepID=UPI00288CEDFF|nr:DUF998 domain-containing protein [Enterococcus avium]MDT2426303.1 DUF998 domain-containing protein [Enterococcus avium]MDT2458010.1 DUF998 domain-containing protein [Enterococcus avium]